MRKLDAVFENSTRELVLKDAQSMHISLPSLDPPPPEPSPFIQPHHYSLELCGAPMICSFTNFLVNFNQAAAQDQNP